jgi:hypothetical protein
MGVSALPDMSGRQGQASRPTQAPRLLARNLARESRLACSALPRETNGGCRAEYRRTLPLAMEPSRMGMEACSIVTTCLFWRDPLQHRNRNSTMSCLVNRMIRFTVLGFALRVLCRLSAANGMADAAAFYIPLLVGMPMLGNGFTLALCFILSFSYRPL